MPMILAAAAYWLVGAPDLPGARLLAASEGLGDLDRLGGRPGGGGGADVLAASSVLTRARPIKSLV